MGTICNHYGGKFNRNFVSTELIRLVQLLKEPISPARPVQETRRPHVRNVSTPGHNHPGSGERQPLIRRRSLDEYDNPPEEDMPVSPLPGGTILGLHNLAIVMPQFIVSGPRSRFRDHLLIPS